MSLIGQWKDEIAKFAPRLVVADRPSGLRACHHADVIIVTPQTDLSFLFPDSAAGEGAPVRLGSALDLPRMHLFSEFCAAAQASPALRVSLPNGCVTGERGATSSCVYRTIIDECHLIPRPGTKTHAKLLMTLSTTNLWLVTGTPISRAFVRRRGQRSSGSTGDGAPDELCCAHRMLACSEGPSFAVRAPKSTLLRGVRRTGRYQGRRLLAWPLDRGPLPRYEDHQVVRTRAVK